MVAAFGAVAEGTIDGRLWSRELGRASDALRGGVPDIFRAGSTTCALGEGGIGRSRGDEE